MQITAPPAQQLKRVQFKSKKLSCHENLGLQTLWVCWLTEATLSSWEVSGTLLEAMTETSRDPSIPKVGRAARRGRFWVEELVWGRKTENLQPISTKLSGDGMALPRLPGGAWSSWNAAMVRLGGAHSGAEPAWEVPPRRRG